MGSSTYTEIVKNAVRLGTLPAELYDQREGGFKKESGWERTNPNKQYGELIVDELCDVSYTGRSRNRVPRIVYLVNTSPDAAGGDQDWVVFSDKKLYVQEFLRTFGLEYNISKRKAVSQTL